MDYFEFIIKKHETLTQNPPVRIFPNKIKNRIVFEIKTGYRLELLIPETMRLLGSTKKDVDVNKNSENVPNFRSVEVVLVHCNLVNNNYQHSLAMLSTRNTEFSFIEVWFTDQNREPLEIEDNVNLTLLLGYHYKNEIFNRVRITKICQRLWILVICKKI